jgi:hypothetical protein
MLISAGILLVPMQEGPAVLQSVEEIAGGTPALPDCDKLCARFR